MKKKKRKLKKRNAFLFLVLIILSLCVGIEISYTHWILTGGPNALTTLASEEVKTCLLKNHPLLGDCLYSMAATTSSSFAKKDADKNLRYIGEDPNNYIDLGETYQTQMYRGISKTDATDYQDFSNMSDCLATNRKCSLVYKKGDPILWRIIGVFHQNGLTYTKVIRESSIGEYSFDSSTIEINEGHGTNEWTTSKIYQVLNQTSFYNQTTGECFTDKSATTSSCDFTQTGLSPKLKDYMYIADWPLGSMEEENINTSLVTDWYTKEHSTHFKQCEVGSFCTDTLERTSLASFPVGLLYPSDLGYATSKEDCLNLPLSTWTKEEQKECLTTNWLMKDKHKMWLLTPLTSKNSNAYGTTYSTTLSLKETFTDVQADIYPVIFLKHELKIAGGFGTKDQPYVIK